MKKYNIVDHFIEKFKAIPTDKWTVGMFFSMFDSSKRCALGHCGIKSFSDSSTEAIQLSELFNKYLNIEVYKINDSSGKYFYNFNTPKERILAALYDIKAKIEAENTKEKIVYVTVDEEVRKLQKMELLEN